MTEPILIKARQVLDFGASRDGVPVEQLGRRVVVDARGHQIEHVDDADAVAMDPDATMAGA